MRRSLGKQEMVFYKIQAQRKCFSNVIDLNSAKLYQLLS